MLVGFRWWPASGVSLNVGVVQEVCWRVSGVIGIIILQHWDSGAGGV